MDPFTIGVIVGVAVAVGIALALLVELWLYAPRRRREAKFTFCVDNRQDDVDNATLFGPMGCKKISTILDNIKAGAQSGALSPIAKDGTVFPCEYCEARDVCRVHNAKE